MKRRFHWVFANSIQMFAGGEIWMLTAMRGLRQRGHTISLICRPGTELARRARAEGFPVFNLQFRGDFDPISIFRAAAILKKIRPDGLLTNMDKELRVVGTAARLVGVRVILPRRGSDFPLKNHTVYRWSYKKLASGVLANSEATKRTLLKNAPWLSPNSVKVIYNGIDPAPYVRPPQRNLRQEFGFAPEDFVVGFVGQLDERKGVFDLLKAFRQLSAKIPHLRLLLCGSGNLREKIVRFLRENHLLKKGVLTGFRDDIPEIMKMIDVLVLPSLWEGFGIVVIEAMAAAKPVVVTRASNLPEIVTDGVEGFWVEPRSPRQIAEALARLAREPALGKKMGEAGRRRVFRQFTLQHMVSALEAYFWELLAK